MELTVNGATEKVDARLLSDLLAVRGIAADRKGVAVALNGAVVPRRDWGETVLSAGDQVEIIEAKQGG